MRTRSVDSKMDPDCMFTPSNAVGRARRPVVACLLAGAAAIALAQGASAQDAEIDQDRETAATTSEFLGVDPGVLALLDGVTLSAPTGPVLTVDGPHSLTLSGTVQGLDATSSIGVFVDTDVAGPSGITLDGSIILNGPEGFELDLGLEGTNTGILIEGDAAFVGDLTLSNTASINIFGAGSTGILINSPFEGDIAIDGNITMFGNRASAFTLNGPLTGDLSILGSLTSTNPDGAGALINGPISGALVIDGVIQAGETITFDDDGNTIDAIPGIAAIQVTESVGAGVLLQGVGVEFTEDGDGDDSTTLTDSVISTNGGTTAVSIVNQSEGSDLTIGLIDGLEYGFVHRGNIDVDGDSAGLSAVGIDVSGFSATARTILEGGIHFDTGLLAVNVIDANATAVRVGNFASAPELLNRGTILAEVATTTTTDDDGNTVFGPGGDAIAVLVEENGSLTSIVNTNAILAGAGNADTDAVGILDRSGTLNSIRNEGTILVDRSNPDDLDVTGLTAAIDVSANTSGVTLFNSGTISGDILLGSGDDAVTFEDGILAGNIDFGLGANSFNLNGTSEFTGSISHGGTLDLFVSGADLELGLDQDLNVTSARFEDGATISIFVDPQNAVQGQFIASDAVFIAGDTQIDPDVTSFVFEQTTYEFLTSGGLTVDTADLDSLLTEAPFIYQTQLGYSGDASNNLALTIRPKTADELALDPNATILYEHFLDTALDPNDQIENALTGLTTREATNNAFTSLVGDVSSASMDLAAIISDVQQSRLRDNLAGFIRRPGRDQAFWAQQVATYANANSSSEEEWNASYLSVGVAVGADLFADENFAWGVQGGFLLSGVNRDRGFGDELSVFSPFLGAYAMLNTGGLYGGINATATYHNLDRERVVAVGATALDAVSNTTAWQFEGTVTAGYQLTAGKFTLRPEVGVSGTSYSESGYEEDGAVSANLRIGSRSMSRVDGFASITAGYDFTWKEGEVPTILRPELFAQYQTLLIGGDPGTVQLGFLATDTTTTFAIDEIGDSVKAAGVAFHLFGQGTAAAMRYTYRERDFFNSHEASLNFRLSF